MRRMLSYKAHFRRFLASNRKRLHFAAHSHHPWPDVTFSAHMQAWMDAAELLDDKWDTIFSVVWPKAQAHVARTLSLPQPDSVAFAPNTHEFVLRLLSCFSDNVNVVTSDSEFHSLSRQLARLEESTPIAVTRVTAEPFATFTERMIDTVNKVRPQLVFVSQVFFNSGAAAVDTEALARALPPDTMLVIDGYHGFLAMPTDLSRVHDRVFYLGGGYKYAMAGEGACFMHVPAGLNLRPKNTGWWAEFGDLQKAKDNQVSYSTGGRSFLGATFDSTALYRFNAAMDWRVAHDIQPKDTLQRTHTLGTQFVQGLRKAGCTALNEAQLVVPLDLTARGQFLTFRISEAAAVCAKLKAADIVTDARGDRLRFGFGLYHDHQDIDALVERVADVLR
jgi:kynureninase